MPEMQATHLSIEDLVKQALVALPIGHPISTREVLSAIREIGPDTEETDGEIVDKIVRLASGWTMTVEFDHAA